MAPPSYARATASSTLKTSPNPSKIKAIETPKGTPKKLKRPSTLTIQDRELIHYQRDLYPIKPRDKSKPCPLASIPSELRVTIYEYVLNQPSWVTYPRQVKTTRQLHYVWPSILHICRAIRIEAAYTYYTQTCFTLRVRNLNFSSVRDWLEKLPGQHRALLARNPCLKIDILPHTASDFTYPPKGYLIDNTMEAHWEACQPFGNLYSVSGGRHRWHFIVFCRLASWWLWCSRPGNRDVMWNYTFQSVDRLEKYSFVCLRKLLKECMTAPWVRRAWTSNTGKTGSMRKEASRLMDALDAWYLQIVETKASDEASEWRVTMDVLKGVLNKW